MKTLELSKNNDLENVFECSFALFDELGADPEDGGVGAEEKEEGQTEADTADQP